MNTSRVALLAAAAWVPWCAAAAQEPARGAPRPAEAQLGGAQAPDSLTPDSLTPDSRTPDSRTPDSRTPDSRVTEQRVLPLRDLAAAGQPLELRGRRSTLDFAIPLPVDATVDAATLRLPYRGGDGARAADSHLTLSLDGRPVATLPAAAANTMVRARIVLPPQGFGGGTNTLRLSGWLEPGHDCSVRALGNLSASIDGANAALVLTLRRGARPPHLSDLMAAGPWLAPGLPLSILTATPVERPGQLAAGALAAESLALHQGAPPTGLRHAVAERADSSAGHGAMPGLDQSRLAGANHVLIGTRAELAPLLAPSVTARIVGPFLGLYPLEADPAHSVLVVSGPDDDEVTVAATRLAGELPALSQANAATLPPTARPTPPLPVQPPTVVALRDMARPTAGFGNGTAPRQTFDLTLPADAAADDDAKAALRLTYSYRAGLSDGSRLHVLVNGIYTAILPLDNPDGADGERHTLPLPARLLKPGVNRIAVEPVLSAAGLACRDWPDGEDRVSISPQSTVVLPPMAHARWPLALDLFATAGHPWLGAEAQPDNLALTVAGHDSDTIAAAWAVMARLAGVAGRPLPDVVAGFGPGSAERGGLVVGAAGAMAPAVTQAVEHRRQAAALRLSGLSDPAQPPPSPRPPWAEQAQARLRDLWGGTRASAPLSAVEIPTDPTPAQPFDAVVTALPTETPDGPPLVVVTAADPATLRRSVDALVRPETWQRLAGDTFAWRAEAEGVAVRQIGPREPQTGAAAAATKRGPVETWLSGNPKAGLAVAAIAVALFVSFTGLLLRRRQGE